MIRSSRPASPLRHLVRYYYQVEAHLVGTTALQPVPARSPLLLEFTFGTPFAVRRMDRKVPVRSAHPIALVGAQTYRRVELSMLGKVDAFAIAFQPGGLSGLFSVPSVEVTNGDFEGDIVLGTGLRQLHDRLADASSFADRVRVADRYLLAAQDMSRDASDIARTALAMHASGGCVRVSDLATNAGLGMRQFERRFRQEIGVPPKLYARIIRFEAALKHKAATPAAQWADIAQSLGYHDQMHMVHDFNRLSGDSPTAICSQLDMFIQPELTATG